MTVIMLLGAMPTSRASASATQAPAITTHTVFVLKQAASLATVVDLVRPLGGKVIAFEHSAPTRGGYFNHMGAAPDTAAGQYAQFVRDRRALNAVFGVRLAGDFSPASLSRPDMVAAYASVPATAAVAVSAAGSGLALIDALVKAPPNRSSVSSKGPGLAVIGTNTWAPDHGRLDASNVIFHILDPDLIGIRRGRIDHELIWIDQADINQFGNDAYEHDFKLFTTGNFGLFGICSGSDNFWVKHTGIVWETTFPADTKPYFDTNAFDDCNLMDFTVGMFWPKNLAPNVTYTISVAADRGNKDSSVMQLGGELLGKRCDLDPFCVGLTAAEHKGFVGFIARSEGVSVPSCRLWSRVLGVPSTAC
jgi:hypothetical protein